MKKKILTVVGARPQFIKAAVLSRIFRDDSNFKEYLVHTGQHYDYCMSQVFFDELGLPRPDINLGIGGGTHGQNTGRMLEKLEECMLREEPNAILVYGDTDSTLAAALAAVKLHIPLIHVEAGLRSYNRCMPEEVNRVLTDHCSEFLFTPSSDATKKLRKEGISENRIHQVGDVMYDAVKYYSRSNEPYACKIVSDYKLNPNGYILATIHRAENTNSSGRLISILTALNEVAATMPVVLPLHPRTKAAIDAENLGHLIKRLTIIPPVGYLSMLALQKHARVIATDSGGVQKEAYFLDRPCVTLREETEWTELVSLGWNKIVGTNTDLIIKTLLDEFAGGEKINVYGDGMAGHNILMRLIADVK